MHGTILTDATLANARFSGADLRGAIVDARTAEAPELGISHLPRRDAGLVESLPEKLAEHRTWIDSLGEVGKRAELTAAHLGGPSLPGRIGRPSGQERGGPYV